jgi:putative intracellular protease/amidase
MFHRIVVTLLVFAALVSSGRAGDAAPKRPVVAIVAYDRGTETTDFLVPYGVLAMSDAVDLHGVSTGAGVVQLHPALRIALDETIDAFDAAHPTGADVVIVPAVHDPSDARLVAWLKTQATHGATLVGICDGVWAVAATGALEGRRATGHWYSLGRLQSAYPGTTWVRDRRYVRDGPVMTTTGVTASIPASLALVEEIAGRARAQDVADRLGVHGWGAEHDSNRFALSAGDVAIAARNWLGVWRWERVGIPVAPGVDEIALALTADAFARTYRASVVAVSDTPGAVRSLHGIRVLPETAASVAIDRLERVPDDVRPVAALDRALAEIERIDGEATASFVALQIEYPARRLRGL